jgi:hypothetical protein
MNILITIIANILIETRAHGFIPSAYNKENIFVWLNFVGFAQIHIRL